VVGSATFTCGGTATANAIAFAMRNQALRPPRCRELSLGYESFAIGGAPGQILTVYHAEPGSRDERALALLESVAAGETAEQPTTIDPRSRA
jgi:hypothetical protein